MTDPVANALRLAYAMGGSTAPHALLPPHLGQALAISGVGRFHNTLASRGRPHFSDGGDVESFGAPAGAHISTSATVPTVNTSFGSIGGVRPASSASDLSAPLFRNLMSRFGGLIGSSGGSMPYMAGSDSGSAATVERMNDQPATSGTAPVARSAASGYGSFEGGYARGGAVDHALRIAHALHRQHFDDGGSAGDGNGDNGGNNDNSGVSGGGWSSGAASGNDSTNGGFGSSGFGGGGGSVSGSSNNNGGFGGLGGSSFGGGGGSGNSGGNSGASSSGSSASGGQGDNGGQGSSSEPGGASPSSSAGPGSISGGFGDPGAMSSFGNTGSGLVGGFGQGSADKGLSGGFGSFSGSSAGLGMVGSGDDQTSVGRAMGQVAGLGNGVGNIGSPGDSVGGSYGAPGFSSFDATSPGMVNAVDAYGAGPVAQWSGNYLSHLSPVTSTIGGFTGVGGSSADQKSPSTGYTFGSIDPGAVPSPNAITSTSLPGTTDPLASAPTSYEMSTLPSFAALTAGLNPNHAFGSFGVNDPAVAGAMHAIQAAGLSGRPTGIAGTMAGDAAQAALSGMGGLDYSAAANPTDAAFGTLAASGFGNLTGDPAMVAGERALTVHSPYATGVTGFSTDPGDIATQAAGLNWSRMGYQTPQKEDALMGYAVNTLGLPAASAAAMIGHFNVESGLKTNAYNPAQEDSHGLAQWNNDAGRWGPAQDWAKTNNQDINDPFTQMNYAKVEAQNMMEPDGLSVWDHMMQAPTLEDASRNWMDNFENPKVKDYSNRINEGRLALSNYGKFYGAGASPVAATPSAPSLSNYTNPDGTISPAKADAYEAARQAYADWSKPPGLDFAMNSLSASGVDYGSRASADDQAAMNALRATPTGLPSQVQAALNAARTINAQASPAAPASFTPTSPSDAASLANAGVVGGLGPIGGSLTGLAAGLGVTGYSQPAGPVAYNAGTTTSPTQAAADMGFASPAMATGVAATAAEAAGIGDVGGFLGKISTDPAYSDVKADLANPRTPTTKIASDLANALGNDPAAIASLLASGAGLDPVAIATRIAQNMSAATNAPAQGDLPGGLISRMGLDAPAVASGAPSFTFNGQSLGPTAATPPTAPVTITPGAPQVALSAPGDPNAMYHAYDPGLLDSAKPYASDSTRQEIGARAVNAALGMIPGFGLVNGLSGLLGGPTVGSFLAHNTSAATPSDPGMSRATGNGSHGSGEVPMVYYGQPGSDAAGAPAPAPAAPDPNLDPFALARQSLAAFYAANPQFDDSFTRSTPVALNVPSVPKAMYYDVMSDPVVQRALALSQRAA